MCVCVRVRAPTPKAIYNYWLELGVITILSFIVILAVVLLSDAMIILIIMIITLMIYHNMKLFNKTKLALYNPLLSL